MSFWRATFPTPLGDMIGVADDTALLMLDFHDRRDMPDALARFNAAPATCTILQRTDEQLAQYFAGTRQSFDIPLNPTGTAFQKAAWQTLRDIPFGRTITYTHQAHAMKRDGGPMVIARAVARANACNFLSVIIPCHRVIGANGNLTGYGGGLVRKQWLIDHEQDHADPDATLWRAASHVGNTHAALVEHVSQ